MLASKRFKRLACLFVTFCLAFTTTIVNAEPQKKFQGTEGKAFIKGHSEAVATYIEPPDKWNAVNASDEELKYFGYPERPSDPNEYKEWEKIVSRKWVKPEFEQPLDDGINKVKNPNDSLFKATSGTYSTNKEGSWGGYAYSASSSTYYGVQQSWQVPKVSVDSSSHTPASSAAWLGLGGFIGSSTLIQTGSDSRIVNGVTSYKLWYECINAGTGNNAPIYLSSVTCSAQTNVFASICLSNVITGSDGRKYRNANFYISSGNGTSTSFTVKLYTYSTVAYTAEWATEMCGDCSYYGKTLNTANQNATSFWACKYQTSVGGSWTTLSDSSSLYRLTQVNGTTTQATPGSITSGGTFNVDWNAY